MLGVLHFENVPNSGEKGGGIKKVYYLNKKLIVKNDEVYISTDILANELERKHQTITKLINEYENELKTLGILRFEIEEISTRNCKKEKRGQPKKFYYLNKKQYIFLITNMRTKANEKTTVMKAKLEIADMFVEMEKWILEQKTQKQNQQYIETRNQSKIGRRQETDIIQIFIEYAKQQGSKSADKYYMIISKMENSAFFVLQEKFKNVREILNIKQLSLIIVADMIVRQAIIEGMDKEMFYKDIFHEAKKRVLEMANSLGFKEILPNVEFKQISMLEGGKNG